MPLTLRSRADYTVAWSIWLLADGSTRVTRIAQADYDEFAVTHRGTGDAPGRPAPDARFLMAAGGIPALDTVDGYPRRGDAWEEDDPAVGRVLVVATSDEPDWRYRGVIATDPGTGRTSRLQGLFAEATGNRLRMPGVEPTPGAGVELDDRFQPHVRVCLVDDVVENHRSVTFDAAATGDSLSGSSITYALTVAAQTDRYLGVSAIGQVTGITYAGVALTQRLLQLTGGVANRQVEYWDLIAPATGANNVVVTFSSALAGANAATAQASYGVDQSSPRSATNTSSGSNQSPALTVTAASGELVLTTTLWRTGGGTNTTDATWTVDSNTTGTISRMASAHKAGGAPSVTRTDALSSAVNADWAMVGVSVKAAATANPIVVTTPAAYQTYQRNSSNQASIAISGTYTGSPAGIEASFNGGAYATIDASPSGGTFSGTLSSQAAGQGTLRVRFTNATGTFADVTSVGIGDVFACAGQSNMSGRATNNQTTQDAIGLTATLFGNDYAWKALADPYDSNAGQVDTVSADPGATGSFIPKLATLVMAYTRLPVAFIPCATGGSAIAAWLPGTDRLNRSTLYGSMNFRIGQVGECRAVLWWQGESDVVSGTPPATYNSSLDSLASAIVTDRGVPLIACTLQQSSGLDDGDEAALNAAIQEAWADNPNVKAGPELSDIDADDPLHILTDAKLAVVASRWWNAIYEALYDQPGGSSEPQRYTGMAGGTKLALSRSSANNLLLRVFILDTAQADGSGRTGLTSASSGLKITVLRERDAAATVYTGGNLESISTLGTYAAPSSGKARFREVDAANLPGVYEIHLAQALAGAGDESRFLTGMVLGATGGAPVMFEVQLQAFDPQDPVRGGLTALPDADAGTPGGLIVG